MRWATQSCAKRPWLRGSRCRAPEPVGTPSISPHFENAVIHNCLVRGSLMAIGNDRVHTPSNGLREIRFFEDPPAPARAPSKMGIGVGVLLALVLLAGAAYYLRSRGAETYV